MLIHVVQVCWSGSCPDAAILAGIDQVGRAGHQPSIEIQHLHSSYSQYKLFMFMSCSSVCKFMFMFFFMFLFMFIYLHVHVMFQSTYVFLYLYLHVPPWLCSLIFLLIDRSEPADTIKYKRCSLLLLIMCVENTPDSSTGRQNKLHACIGTY